jgi:citronellol/citronellal dehydrogenase
MAKAALERFSTGLAGELYDDNIAVNALSPSKAVPTPGTVYHQLTTYDDPDAEPASVMAEAALMLCSAEPKSMTGRIAYSQELLAELGPPADPPLNRQAQPASPAAGPLRRRSRAG